MRAAPSSDIRTEDELLEGPHGAIPVRRYSPAGAGPGIALVWVHGGAFVSGGLDQLESHAVALELAGAGIPVVTVDYRLAPRFGREPSRRGRLEKRSGSVRYPIPLDDVQAAVEDAQRRHPSGVLVGGASAGACLAAAATLRLQAASAAAPLAVLLAYGTFHAALPPISPELRSRLTGRRRYLHTPRLLALANLNYAGSRAAMHERFALPGGHELAGFPPTLVLDAEADSMRASGEQFARELRDAGTEVERHVLAGSRHAFLHRPADPAFAHGIGLITGWAGRIARMATAPAGDDSSSSSSHSGRPAGGPRPA